MKLLPCGDSGLLVEVDGLPEVLAERIRHAVTVLGDDDERERLVAGCRRWASGKSTTTWSAPGAACAT